MRAPRLAKEMSVELAAEMDGICHQKREKGVPEFVTTRIIIDSLGKVRCS